MHNSFIKYSIVLIIYISLKPVAYVGDHRDELLLTIFKNRLQIL